ncbi:unnamed protein product, partial [Phaeothamnion confervicola]
MQLRLFCGFSDFYFFNKLFKKAKKEEKRQSRSGFPLCRGRLLLPGWHLFSSLGRMQFGPEGCCLAALQYAPCKAFLPLIVERRLFSRHAGCSLPLMLATPSCNGLRPGSRISNPSAPLRPSAFS